MTSVPWLSIIIPTYNEAINIRSLIMWLKKETDTSQVEIIITDGGSTDDTIAIAEKLHTVVLISPQKGRASQMNYGAAYANGKVLYFIHADCRPPEGFINDISLAVKENYGCGRYQTRFDSNKFLLKINAFFTRFDWLICYGGDQTFFIRHDLFTKLGGFKSEMGIMEDYDLTRRAKQISRYKIFNKPALISARKYNRNSWLTVQLANRKIVQMYRNGRSQQEMTDTYRRLLNQG